MVRIVVVLGMSLGLAACSEEEPEGPIIPPSSTYRLLIGNEGGFTFGNASLDAYDPEEESYSTAVFQAANDRPLGDVLQDVSLIDGRLYLVVNNSNRVEVVDTSDFSLIGSITGLTSPRYILQATKEKLYVTDFLANEIHIIDPVPFRKTGAIPLQGWTEELIKVGEEVFVTNRFSSFLYIIDIQTDVLVDSIQVAYGPGAIIQDAEGMLWVYCAGDPVTNEDGGLFRIEPSSRRIEKQFTLPVDAGLFPRLALDSEKDTLFFLLNGVYELDIRTTQLPIDPHISASGKNFYGLDFDTRSNSLLVADAKDFQQKGDVLFFDRSGRNIRRLQAGIIPSRVLLLP